MRKNITSPKRRSAAEWRRVVQAWRQSGLTAASFAERRGLNAATLRFWAWRLARDGAAPATPEAEPLRLVSVDVVGPEPEPPHPEWVMELRDGSVLRVRGELSESALRAILEVGGAMEGRR
jgi:transposase-like protein